MTLTVPSINFPDPDSHDAATSLNDALVNAVATLGALPKIGIILKVREDEANGEQIVNWTLADQSQIEMIAFGLSVSPPKSK